MPAPFDLAFVQRAAVEVALLAVASGILGTWIVLRGLSFYAHAVGTAAFPGLVLADGLGFSPLVGALALGVILASDVFHSQGNVERLLFGSLLVISGTDQLVAAVAGAAVVL